MRMHLGNTISRVQYSDCQQSNGIVPCTESLVYPNPILANKQYTEGVLSTGKDNLMCRDDTIYFTPQHKTAYIPSLDDVDFIDYSNFAIWDNNHGIYDNEEETHQSSSFSDLHSSEEYDIIENKYKLTEGKLKNAERITTMLHSHCLEQTKLILRLDKELRSEIALRKMIEERLQHVAFNVVQDTYIPPTVTSIEKEHRVVNSGTTRRATFIMRKKRK
jgi:hypothetical protein